MTFDGNADFIALITLMEFNVNLIFNEEYYMYMPLIGLSPWWRSGNGNATTFSANHLIELSCVGR
jgi:hypothetical protein